MKVKGGDDAKTSVSHLRRRKSATPKSSQDRKSSLHTYTLHTHTHTHTHRSRHKYTQTGGVVFSRCPALTHSGKLLCVCKTERGMMKEDQKDTKTVRGKQSHKKKICVRNREKVLTREQASQLTEKRHYNTQTKTQRTDSRAVPEGMVNGKTNSCCCHCPEEYKIKAHLLVL